MELRIWLLLALVLMMGFAVIVTGVAVVYFSRRVKRLELLVGWQDERLYDLTKSVDAPTFSRYETRRAARKIVVQ